MTDFPVCVFGVIMAGKHLIDGKLCVVGVNVQSSLERFEQGEDGGGGKLKARMLTTENNGRLAIFGPGCMAIAAVGGFDWRPEALE